MKPIGVILLATVFSSGVFILATAQSTTYRAGVVEYHPPTSGVVQDTTSKNLENYLAIIKNASNQQVDILVFPEATLNRGWGISDPQKAAFRVPAVEEKVTPCGLEEYSIVLRNLSCAAATEKMYIVVNVAEAAICSETGSKECKADDEVILFNTNVVFDRNGMVISRYRKINLWGETGFTGSIDRALGTFETDFGVKFGHFICFDILFQEPAVAVVEKANVRNVLFPTQWFSELPSLTAVEIQAAWAHTHNVNFLAAGANNPQVGSTGTGIYSGKAGAIKSLMSGKTRTELLVADVPKIPASETVNTPVVTPNADEMDSLYLKRYSMSLYKNAIIDENKEFQEHELSYGNTTCEFKIRQRKLDVTIDETTKYYSYRAVMYDGIRSFEFKDAGVTECGIVACTSDDILSCGKRFPKYSEITPAFELTEVALKATVRRPTYNATMETLDTAYYPVTVLTSIMPLRFDEYAYKVIDANRDDGMITIDMRTDRPQTDLLMFGIFGRTFHTDETPAEAKEAPEVVKV